jgi:hypothetical protein
LHTIDNALLSQEVLSSIRKNDGKSESAANSTTSGSIPLTVTSTLKDAKLLDEITKCCQQVANQNIHPSALKSSPQSLTMNDEPTPINAPEFSKIDWAATPIGKLPGAGEISFTLYEDENPLGLLSSRFSSKLITFERLSAEELEKYALSASKSKKNRTQNEISDANEFDE